MRNRIEVPPLSVDAAGAYWRNIKKNGLTNHSREYPGQVGHPVRLDSSLVAQCNEGARAAQGVIGDLIAETGGVTGFTRRYGSVTFGPFDMNIPPINMQLDSRIAQGYGLPLSYDVLLTRHNGEPSVRVIELQTAVGYETLPATRLDAAGIDPTSPATRFGGELPAVRYASFADRFAGGEPIVVMDTDPFDGTKVDKIGMQQMVGGPDDLPISPLDIAGHDKNGYYFYPYVTDSNRPFDVVRDENEIPVRDTSVKKYANNVLSRMCQADLLALWEKCKTDPARANLIVSFLTDSNINWIWHPSWQHIGDKTIMPVIRERLEGSKLAEQFVPIYSTGQKVDTPGTYFKKPTDRQCGVGQSIVKIGEGDPVVVEDGFVYQQVIVPFPVLTYLPGNLAASMRRSSQTTLQTADREAGDVPRAVTSQLELRSLIALYHDQEDVIGRNMARMAPRWTSPSSLDRSQTNTGQIYHSLHAHLDQNGNGQDHGLYPYGFAPVIVS